MLGENVPSELIFPAATPKARQRASTLSVPESTFEQHRRGAVPHSLARLPALRVQHPAAAAAAAAGRCRRGDVQLPLDGPLRARDPHVVRQHRTSSDSAASSEHPASRSSDASTAHLPPAPQTGGMGRKEQVWSGKWRGNIGNMEDIARSLHGGRPQSQ
ncbi:hypothetical protein DFH09DRAFT_1343201 [Mycena vulgaris]|nr:hypothetical protein DFH09DRAFT_1343201 [Mycena vulgaris]